MKYKVDSNAVWDLSIIEFYLNYVKYKDYTGYTADIIGTSFILTMWNIKCVCIHSLIRAFAVLS